MVNLLIKILTWLGDRPPEIRKGSTRVVWVFPRLCFAIKFPLIHLKRLLREYYMRDPAELLQWFQDYSVECMLTPKWYLFKGLRDNWMEFVFFVRHWRTPFLFPTYFSFFGLFNITPFGEEVPEDDKYWSRMLDVTDEDVLNDNHHFSEDRNFCFYKGRWRMRDYGSRVTRELIVRHLKAFNLLSKEFAPK